MRAFLLGAALVATTACAGDQDRDDDINDPDGDGDGDGGSGGGGGGGGGSDDTPVDEVARDYDGVASAIGASAYVGELSAMLDIVVISEGGMPEGISYLGSNDQHFHHASGSRGGLTFHYMYHCNDAGDLILPTCDGNANHSHVDVSWSGGLEGAAMSIESVALEGNWAVRDLSVDKPRVGGDGKMSFVARIAGGAAATFNISYDATFDRVRFAPGQAFPASGKIDLLIAAERTRSDATRTFAVTGSLAFAGTSAAILTLDATNTYSIDLTSGIATKR